MMPMATADKTVAGGTEAPPLSVPPTNSTVSAPSRRTASATTMSSAQGAFCPPFTDCPSCRASLTISLVCVLTQTQCHSSISKASDKTLMFTTS